MRPRALALRPQGLRWAFGFSKDIIGGVHNLTTDSRNVST